MASSSSDEATAVKQLRDSGAAKLRLARPDSFYIDGHWLLPGASSPAVASLETLNPATERPLATIPIATAHYVDLAVEAARQAFIDPARAAQWSRLSGHGRAQLMRRVADALDARARPIALLETMDNGKPYMEAAWDLEDAAGCWRFFAGEAEKLDAGGERRDVGDPGFVATVHREPAGVVAAITPFNYPLLIACWKVCPALAAGCSVVLKPSELTPLSSLELAALVHDAGFPAGVFNVVTGDGSTGAALAAHPGIDRVTFTGSENTGKKVMHAATENVVPVGLELGGKSAMIIFPDVDLDKAVEWAMFGCFWTNGQICSSTSRVLVHDSIADGFLKLLVERTGQIRIGDPLHDSLIMEKGIMGPVVARRQQQRAQKLVQDAIIEGATVICGGAKSPDPARVTCAAGNVGKGFYVAPTVLRVTPANAIWSTEVFAPVLSVATFSTEAEAIALANDSPNGLAGAVLSDDQERCARVARELQVGIVWINCSQPCFTQLPWGGRGRAGIGRDLGPESMHEYLEVKQVVNYAKPDHWQWYYKPQHKM